MPTELSGHAIRCPADLQHNVQPSSTPRGTGAPGAMLLPERRRLTRFFFARPPGAVRPRPRANCCPFVLGGKPFNSKQPYNRVHRQRLKNPYHRRESHACSLWFTTAGVRGLVDFEPIARVSSLVWQNSDGFAGCCSRFLSPQGTSSKYPCPSTF
jgi:hypothetical protein